jgi:hypothetical protein
MQRRGVLYVCGIVVQLLLVGCSALRSFEPYETVRPQTPPVRNLTSFTPALRCMDRLFAQYGLGSKGMGSGVYNRGGHPG